MASPRIFDVANMYWQPDHDLNRIFLEVMQHQANMRLQARGFLFLNEVHDMLGLTWTSAGQVEGWVTDQNPDAYIDFGINEAREVGAFQLNFNVQGDILSALEDR